MKRRQHIIGIGAIAGAGSAVGTGAFTSVSAERGVTVETADDADALLAMEPLDTPNGNEFATAEDGVVVLDFSSTNAGGSELGVDSIYDFDDVFRVTNQSTQPVYLWATFADSTGSFEIGTPEIDVWLYADGDSENKLRDSTDDVRYLTVGASADLGVHVDTDDLDEDQELTITITASAEKPADEPGVVGGGPTRIEGPADGLVNHWPLDSVGDGGVIDAVGTSDPTAAGGLSSTSGVVDGAARFDGDDGVITTDLNPGASGKSLTVAGWLRRPCRSRSGTTTSFSATTPTASMTGSSPSERTTATNCSFGFATIKRTTRSGSVAPMSRSTTSGTTTRVCATPARANSDSTSTANSKRRPRSPETSRSGIPTRSSE